MKKLFALLLSLLLLTSLCSAAFAEPVIEDLAAVQKAGKLVVGITDFEPMDYQDEKGEWIGFDADLARAFAESLGVEVEFVEIDWDMKLMELRSKNIDCIWNGMTLTPEVLEASSCSNPYMLNAQVIVVRAEDVEKYADVAAMSELSFAVEAGSAGEAAVNELGYTAKPVASQADALLEVKAGASDACVIDLLMAVAMVGEGTSYDDLSFTFDLNEEQYGVAFRQNSDLVDVFNAFLLENNALMIELAETYGLAGSVIEQSAEQAA